MRLTTLHTIGYEKRSLREFIALLKANDIHVVVDVRETTWTRKPGFFKATLMPELLAEGIEYHHASYAGNPRALRKDVTDPAEILDRYRIHLSSNPQILTEFDELIEALTSEGKRVAIMTFCAGVGLCHRDILAAAWSNSPMRQIVHLGAPVAEAPSPIVPEEMAGVRA